MSSALPTISIEEIHKRDLLDELENPKPYDPTCQTCGAPEGETSDDCPRCNGEDMDAIEASDREFYHRCVLRGW